ncbi:MAG: hypothetical protein Kow0075_14090 [Salibacteraceae bacterium]
MGGNNSIDDIFKKGLQNRDVPYNEDAWAAAEAMLNRHYRVVWVKKLLLYAIPLGGLLAFGLIALTLTTELDFFNQNDTTAPGTARTAPAAILKTETPNISPKNERRNPSAVDAPQPTATGTIARPELAQPPAHIAAGASSGSAPVDQTPTGGETAHSAHRTGVHPSTKSEKALFDVSQTKAYRPETAHAANDRIEPMPFYQIGALAAKRHDLVNPQGEPARIALDFFRRFELRIEVGGLTASRFQSNNRSALPAAGIYAQLLADYHFSSAAFISTGIGSFGRGGIGPQQTIASTGGSVRYRPLQAYYLNVPITVNYRFGARHSIGLGVQFNPLLQVLIAEETLNGENKQTGSRKVFDNTGFATLDFGLCVPYRVALSERTTACVSLVYGVTDVSENLGNRYPFDDRNHMIRFGISRLLVRH